MKMGFNAKMLLKTIKKLGDKDLKIEIEPKFSYAGRIKFKNKFKYFYGNFIDLNERASSEIVKDKAYTYYWLKQSGWPIPEGKEFFFNHWSKKMKSTNDEQKALIYAQQKGWPLIVKPNDLKAGEGVFLVNDKKSLKEAIENIKKMRVNVFLVQKLVLGDEFRLVVLDKEIVLKYYKKPFYIEGDGQTSIKKLLLKQLTKPKNDYMSDDNYSFVDQQIFVYLGGISSSLLNIIS